jgi:hypothetical protein
MPTDDCVIEYEKFKLQNSSGGPKRAYLIFRIKDEKIQIAEQGPAEASWDDFINVLRSNPKDGAYGLYDFKAETGDGRKLIKIIFVAWAPDNLPVKAKMVYASASQPFKQALGSGMAVVIQASDVADLDLDTIHKLVIKA